MKKIPCKDGFIYKSMKKHRAMRALRLGLVIMALITYFLAFRPYILNYIKGSVPMNGAAFKAEAELIALEPVEADSLVIKNYALKARSYWQEESYEFDVKLSDVYDTKISYTTVNTGNTYAAEGESEEGVESARLYTAKLEGVDIIVLAYPHQLIADGETITGIFTEIPPVIANDLTASQNNTASSYYKYMLDTRGIEMESERFDVLVCTILLLVIAYMLIGLILQFINPYFTPTYRRLHRYGDVETVIVDIERQLKEAGITKIGKKEAVVCTDWIVKEDSSRLKIIKNHAKPLSSTRYGSKL